MIKRGKNKRSKNKRGKNRQGKNRRKSGVVVQRSVNT